MRPTAATIVRDACPACGSTPFKKNGHTHNGKQNHQCKALPRQFVTEASEQSIPPEQRTLIERLLCERISLRGICRAVGVSLPWLLHCMVECFAAWPDHVHVQRRAAPTRVCMHQVASEAPDV